MVVRKRMSAIEALNQEQKLLMFSNWQFVKIDEAILSQTKWLISKYSLKSHVTIHVISAFNRKIELIISSDQDFDVVQKIERVTFLAVEGILQSTLEGMLIV